MKNVWKNDCTQNKLSKKCQSNRHKKALSTRFFSLFTITCFSVLITLTINKQTVQKNTRLNSHTFQKTHLPSTVQAIDDRASVQTVSFSTQWINQPDAMQMLKQMDDDELTGYLENMIPKKRLFKLIDKRIFAQNALNILYQQNTPETIQSLRDKTHSSITMGLTPTYTKTHADTRTVDIEKKLYAHLKTPHNELHAGKVFVTWIHRESGQVMLFNMMYLNPHSTENWVSLTPSSGWLTGSYDVNVYRFSNQLEPIAKHTFSIEHVINDGLDADEWDLNELMPEENDTSPEKDTDTEEALFEI